MSDSTIHRYFAFEHLPPPLREISEPICVAALSDDHPRMILERIFDHLQDLAADGRVLDEQQLTFAMGKVGDAERILDRKHVADDAFWLLVLEMKDCAVRACLPPMVTVRAGAELAPELEKVVRDFLDGPGQRAPIIVLPEGVEMETRLAPDVTQARVLYEVEIDEG